MIENSRKREQKLPRCVYSASKKVPAHFVKWNQHITNWQYLGFHFDHVLLEEDTSKLNEIVNSNNQAGAVLCVMIAWKSPL